MAKRKSEKRQRQKCLSVRCNAEEHQALQSRADLAGLSLSGYLRHTILETEPPRQSFRPVKDHEKLAVLLASVGRIGNNINQLAHIANTGSWPETASLEEACTQIRAMRDLLIEALGKQPLPDHPPDSPDGSV
jgi:putative N-acetylmannosamine-6-phosphate epimerase